MDEDEDEVDDGVRVSRGLHALKRYIKMYEFDEPFKIVRERQYLEARDSEKKLHSV